MSDYKIWNCRASDEELIGLTAAFRNRHEGDRILTFSEGPTSSEIVDASTTSLDAGLLSILWQLRSFTPTAELAARRVSFDDGGDWRVRYIGPTPPAEDCWSEPKVLDTPDKPKKAALYGRCMDRGSLAFYELQFSNATLDYPPPSDGAWREGNYAWLEFVEHSCPNGSIVRWLGIVRG